MRSPSIDAASTTVNTGSTVDSVDACVGPTRASPAKNSVIAATVETSDKTVSVRFDTNKDGDVPWTFRPEKTTMTVRLGERYMAYFIARNNSDQPVTGQASYNIEPEQTAIYFNKIQCFCFTRQTLKPHEEVRMPVTFYVDPKMLTDENSQDVEQITLSYTFHKLKDPA